MNITSQDSLRAPKRREKIGKLLAAANILGVVLMLALAVWLTWHRVSPWWVILVVGIFSLGASLAVGAMKYSKEPSAFWSNAALVCLLIGALGGFHESRKAHSSKPAESVAPPAVDSAATSENQPAQYAAVIDAGSSGSRLWIFEWSKDKKGDPKVDEKLRLADEKVPDNKKQKCPLTDVTTKKTWTCDCLKNLLKEGHQRVARGSAVADIPLWVKATGGVRKKTMKEQVDILTNTEDCLKEKSAPHYSLKSAEAIAGQNEALYAWLAINYWRKTLQKDSVGIVEIGGQSAQFAFKVDKPIAATQRGTVLTVPLKSGDLYVYAHSDVLGKDAAIAALGGRLANDLSVRDCGLTDDYRKCLLKIDGFICNRSHESMPCPHRSPEFSPGNIEFIGLSNFMHITRNVGLANDPLSAVRARAETMCTPGPDRDKLQQKWIAVTGIHKEDVCLDAVYTTQVAHHAWDLRLAAITPAADTDPEWPLGAMLMEVAQALKDPP